MPAHLPPMNSSWEISDTAHRTVNIARGLVEAATSDDVSAVALHCCAQFGATLPVATETRVKIEQLARRNHTSHVLNFIKAQIGYRKDDSVEQLSRSDSGVRFLCFGATLCTLNQYEAADRLDSLLQATQRHDQLRPTVRQLQVMLTSLKSKLALSDFATSVTGFEILIRSRLVRTEKRFNFDGAFAPSKPSLQDLVLALNQLGRLSEVDTIDGLEIKTRACYAPWICAFVKWMLGVQPQIGNSDGVSLWESYDSKVIVTIVPNREKTGSRRRLLDSEDRNLDVIIKERIRNIREIIVTDPIHQETTAWQGLLPTEAWFRYAFQLLHHKFPEIKENEALGRAIGHVLCYVVKYLPDRLLLCGNAPYLSSSYLGDKLSESEFFDSSYLAAFPSAEIRVAIAHHLVSDQIQLIDNGTGGSDMLLLSNLAPILHKGCLVCLNSIVLKAKCRVSEFFRLIAIICATMTVLPLFGPDPKTYPMLASELLFVSYEPRGHGSRENPKIKPPDSPWLDIVGDGWQGLMYGRYELLSCTPWSIFTYAAQMIGYKNLPRATVIAAKSGQVLFPTFLEADGFNANGYMSLSAFPGKLLKDNMEFTALIERQSGRRNDSDTESSSDTDEKEYDSGLEHGRAQPAGLSTETSSQTLVSAGSDQSKTTVHVSDETKVAEAGQANVELGITNDSVAQLPVQNDVTSSAQRIATIGETEPTLYRQHGMHRNFVPFKSQQDLQLGVTEWTVSVVNDTLLGEPKRILFEVNTDTDPSRSVTLNKGTWWLIEALFGLYLTPPCPHSLYTDAGEQADQFDVFGFSRHVRPRTGTPTLYNVGRSYGAQLLQLSFEIDLIVPTIIHGKGCVRCALALCIEHHALVIIS